MLKRIIESKRSTKRLISVCYDSITICLALYLALALRLGSFNPTIKIELLQATAVTVLITIAIFTKLGLYRAILRFATIEAVINVSIGVSASAITLACSSFFLNTGIPRSTPIIFFLTSFILLGAPRLLFRSLLRLIRNPRENHNKTAVAIYGAGYTGYQLAAALENDKSNYKVVAFIDDDTRLDGSKIRNIRAHHYSKLSNIIANHEIQTVLLALGNTPRSKKSEIIQRLEQAKLKTLTVPPIEDIISGKANIVDIKPVAIEDLLGRDPVPARPELLDSCIKDKVVMVTGAGGSIGSELCRQIIKQKPTSLILFELNEYNLYQVDQELQLLINNTNSTIKLIPLIGSVQSRQRLEKIMSSFTVQTVYHAAAYKHVPIVEHNIVEGVNNNIFGTWYCAEAAIKAKVESFVLISTDKAVRPTNIMGTTKRVAELVLQGLAQRQTQTRFSMVRFGNVLGSSGSVVPLFRKQINKNGPITVTHPDITRYFMTIPEASELVIQAGSMSTGGDVFVLDMGEPVKIIDLAKRMVHLSGLEIKDQQHPNGDIEIKVTGLRPGEKLYEELLIGKNVIGTEHARILKAEEISLTWPQTQVLLHELETACQNAACDDIKNLLLQAPTDYESDETISDWVWNSPKNTSALRVV
jgi:FlaA1/EpsC-like NDP-sugar epimerase